ncbi:serine/threonine protein kinase [Dactylosporangium roseum]|uniref:non-specific serine/threonine protein kinase n=1 Tax=Dactylosporangium roseum TaxID=47989 RepID=A0ABY5YXH5_9ACTN|nr:serine/threonine-protein kinase [Dactylosporangium roseum]UWZ34461.1 serine/threonine protein kinase [Dactylosporangium roseum]
MTTTRLYDRIVEGYRVVGRIRRGPEATVYHAVREADGTAVALKVLRTDARVDADLSRLRRLPRHPHIVRVLDVGRAVDGRPYLAMVYYPDGSYADALNRSGPVEVAEAVRVGIAVAEALQAVHNMNLIHRDVTPANILCGTDGAALTDFDIAESPAELAGTVALDRLTPPNASPESLLRQPQDARSDVYSLASTLWTLLAGHPPFAVDGDASPDPFDYRERVLHDAAPPPVPVPDVPLWLQASLRRAMARAPEDRYASAADFAAALRDASEPWPDGVPEPGQAAEPAPPVLAPPVDPPLLAPPVDQPMLAAPVDPPMLAPPVDPPVLAPPLDVPVLDLDDGWWSREEGSPGAPPDGDPSDDAYESFRPYRPRRSRRSLRTVGVAVVLFAVVGVAAFVVAPMIRAAVRGPGAKPTPQASPALDATPQDVALSDERVAVTLTWRDPTAGEAAFFIVGTPTGGTPSTVANAARGTTSIRINGINPTVDYCFVLVAALSVDRVANAKPVCTQRFPATSASPSTSSGPK